MDKKKRKSILTSSNKHLKPILYHENLLSKLKQTNRRKQSIRTWGLAILPTLIEYLFGLSTPLFHTTAIWLARFLRSFVKKPLVNYLTSLSLSLLINSLFASFTPL